MSVDGVGMLRMRRRIGSEMMTIGMMKIEKMKNEMQTSAKKMKTRMRKKRCLLGGPVN